MEDIVSKLVALLEDKPYLILDDETIKAYIEDNMDKLIEEIREEVIRYRSIDLFLDEIEEDINAEIS